MRKSHLDFWTYTAEQISSKQYEPSEDLVKLLLKIVEHNTHPSLHFNQIYEKKILYVLELVADKITKDKRHFLMNWISTTEGISLLSACTEK